MRKPHALRRALARRAAPKPVATEPAGPDVDAQIAHINELTQTARGHWLGLLAFLAFVFVTVLGVEDVDFFVPSRRTDLPLVGVAIPTQAFFQFAPLLAAALYINLHLTIRKCTEAVTAAPATVKGLPLQDRLSTWLLTGMVLRLRRDGSARPRVMDWLATLFAPVFVWLAGPAVIALVWVRSWPAHEEGLSTLIAVALALTLYVGLASWLKLWADLRAPWLAGRMASAFLLSFGIVTFLGLAGWTLVKTEGGIDHLVGPDRPDWADQSPARPVLRAIASGITGARDETAHLLGQRGPDWMAQPLLASGVAHARTAIDGIQRWTFGTSYLAPADLSGERLSVLPPEDADPSVARERFRTEWCQRQNLAPEICGPVPAPGFPSAPALTALRDAWCTETTLVVGETCADHFAGLETRFADEWDAFRSRTIEALAKPDFTGRDLRNADLSRAALTGIVFTGARLQGADLTEVQLERARFTCSPKTMTDAATEAGRDACRRDAADLTGATLTRARLERADLAFAQLQGAVLSWAQMPGADLSRAEMQGADLWGAQMQGAELSEAAMRGAYLGWAQMQGADLRGVAMQEADLGTAQMQGAELREAAMQGAVLSWAQMQGADLSRADLSRAEMQGADLSRADLSRAEMQGADLRGVAMQGADLREAQMQGADLSWAQMQSASWAGATLRGSWAQDADFRDARDLTQADLSSVIGNAAALLPDAPDPATGQPLYLCSCWTSDPPDFPILLSTLTRLGFDEAQVRDPSFVLFCAPGETPQKTGTPWPLDRIPAWYDRDEDESDADFAARVSDRERLADRGPCPAPEPHPAGTP